jgi:alkanesulfonate monooxygenase SsuD/methylene tetrahydromethanopterin reductase-like flavin-dependent oxidoreductase (luciferase family)
VSQGRAATPRDKLQTAAEWRARAEAKKLSIRELMIEVTSPASFVGTPSQVAAKIVEAVDQEAADGFILVPHVTPGGLDEFADTVVPILQDANRFRHEYEGSTLRDHLGLGAARPSSARSTTSVLA